VSSYCGDLICNAIETSSDCPFDCGGGGGSDAGPSSYCGDLICSAIESQTSCPSDCGGGVCYCVTQGDWFGFDPLATCDALPPEPPPGPDLDAALYLQLVTE